MPGAYILINIRPGVEKQVIDELSQLPGVVHVEGVYGGFDIIVRIEFPTDGMILRTLDKVRRIDGIKSTLTMSFIPGQQKGKTGLDADHLGPPSD
ncbi:Lrp/AsnC ligand binding domain-containing protein [Nitrososphaera viennensis]|uniref:Transcriptional regulator, AsnC family n=2 Tax=Nitrososphaera viennensis TaxID=1034015 RepID=A0A060HSU5_9ARCH|nr:Lrp/AsnC ligand binding domain-containing protein [Nitrososphaera viennensis]AIC16237.1 Transcriptional regulator, AsnC family [Nitrososphaera viennensis EN76]UVS68177.1 Lrp/AsnC ligand binding domain-containing protein [Nitrososphaera viennensis]